ncbi:MAG: hypothetical protein R3E66_05700 [bacterium]
MKNKLQWMVMAASFGMTACGEAPQDSACDQATAHMQACFPEQSIAAPDMCTDSVANDILAKNCDELAQVASASAGASDGYCNPFFWWACSSGGSSAPVREGYTFNLGISVCETELCVEDLFGTVTWGAECGKITLEDGHGDVVAVDYINDFVASGSQGTGDGFKDLDLPKGVYTARLWRRDGELASTVEGGRAEIKVELGEDGKVDLERRNFRILKSESEEVRACADVQGTLASTCDAEPMSKEDTEWTWVVQITGTNEEGTYDYVNRSRFVYDLQTHSFVFPKVRAGQYELTYIELDVWSSYARERNLNADYDDYLELIERYGTGRTFTETVDVTDADIAAGKVVGIGHVDLESETCR